MRALIAPALAFEPVHHIPIELGIDRHLEGRDANRGVGPMVLVRSRIVLILGGDPFNLRAGYGPQTLRQCTGVKKNLPNSSKSMPLSPKTFSRSASSQLHVSLPPIRLIYMVM